MAQYENGVSVVICCHNSVHRLGTTLAHLVAQRVEPGLSWEVLLVDNGSTDTTASTAYNCWSRVDIPFRVVPEPRLGLSYARQRGLAEARYPIVSFIDDDNWVCPDWVQLSADIMGQFPSVAVCNGFAEAVCEVSPPAWFQKCMHMYASSPNDEVGDITWAPALPSGSGLGIRKEAWNALVSKGFQFVLTGRQGGRLSSGEDSELCIALRIAGWRFWRDPRLRFQHFIEAKRLTWAYLRRLNRESAESALAIIAYEIAERGHPVRIIDRARETWQWQTGRTLRRLTRNTRGALRLLFDNREGDHQALLAETMIARLVTLLKWRTQFTSQINQIRNSRWRKPPYANVCYAAPTDPTKAA